MFSTGGEPAELNRVAEVNINITLKQEKFCVKGIRMGPVFCANTPDDTIKLHALRLVGGYLCGICWRHSQQLVS